MLLLQPIGSTWRREDFLCNPDVHTWGWNFSSGNGQAVLPPDQICQSCFPLVASIFMVVLAFIHCTLSCSGVWLFPFYRCLCTQWWHTGWLSVTQKKLCYVKSFVTSSYHSRWLETGLATLGSPMASWWRECCLTMLLLIASLFSISYRSCLIPLSHHSVAGIPVHPLHGCPPTVPDLFSCNQGSPYTCLVCFAVHTFHHTFHLPHTSHFFVT